MAYVIARQSFTRCRLGADGSVSPVIQFMRKRSMTASGNFEPVASIHDIPEEGVFGVVMSDGRRVCLIRSQGRVTAVADNCTHQEFEMSLGDVLPVFDVRIEGHTVLVGPRSVRSPQSAVSPDSAVSPQSAINRPQSR